MRRFRVIDGSNDGSLEVHRALVPAPADGSSTAPPQPAESPSAESPSAVPQPAEPPPAPRPSDADDAHSVDGLITASTSYHAALQTTAHIRQRSLLDFLR